MAGGFSGGALHFDDGTTLTQKGVWHRIDGRIPHWNDEHTGTKYSIILYKQNHTTKQELIAERKGGPGMSVQETAEPEAS